MEQRYQPLIFVYFLVFFKLLFLHVITHIFFFGAKETSQVTFLTPQRVLAWLAYELAFQYST